MKTTKKVAVETPVVEAPVTNVVIYTLNEKAAKLADEDTGAAATLQASAPKTGKEWRKVGVAKPNTRAAALAAVRKAHPDGFTHEQAVAALIAARKAGLNLGQGTPGSYAKAFVKNGYFAPKA
jgi:hypothetical protein